MEKPTKRNLFPPLPLPQQGPARPTAPAGTAAPGVAARSQEAVPASGAQFGSTQRHLAAPSGSNQHRRDLQLALTSNKRSKTQAPPPTDPADEAAAEALLQLHHGHVPTPVAEGFAVAQSETAVNDEDWDKVWELMRGADIPNLQMLEVKNSGVSPKALGEFLEKKGPIQLGFKSKKMPAFFKMENRDDIFKVMGQLNAKLALDPSKPGSFDRDTRNALLGTLDMSKKTRLQSDVVGTFCLNVITLEEKNYFSVLEAITLTKIAGGWAKLNTVVTSWESFRDFALSKERILRIAKNEFGDQLLQGLLKVLPQLYEKLELLSQDQMSSGGTSDNVAQKDALKKRKEEILKDIFMKDIRITNYCVKIINAHLYEKNRNPITKESWPSVKDFLLAIRRPFNTDTLKDHLQKLNEILKNPTSPS
jgi:hypothetical protein